MDAARCSRSRSIGRINTLFPKIKKYQPVHKPCKSFENTLNRANSPATASSKHGIPCDLVFLNKSLLCERTTPCRIMQHFEEILETRSRLSRRSVEQAVLRRRPALWQTSLFGWCCFIQMIQYLFYNRRVFNAGDHLYCAPALITDFYIHIKNPL